MLNKYTKCNIWRLAVQYDIYIYVIRLLKVKMRKGRNMLSVIRHST